MLLFVLHLSYYKNIPLPLIQKQMESEILFLTRCSQKLKNIQRRAKKNRLD